MSRAAILKHNETAKRILGIMLKNNVLIDQGNKNNKYCIMLALT